MFHNYNAHIGSSLYRIIEQLEQRKSRPPRRKPVKKLRRLRLSRPRPEPANQLWFDFKSEPDFDWTTGSTDCYEAIRQNAAPLPVTQKVFRRKTATTWLPFDLARRITVKQSIPVGVVSLGPTGRQVAYQMLLAESGLESRWLRRKPWPMWFYSRIIQAADRLKKSPLFVEHASNPSLRGLVLRIRRLHKAHGIRFLFVAEAQHLSSKRKSRSAACTVMSRLSDLSHELDMPVLMFSPVGL